MKLTRHNGRSGKHGAYNPRHNDRRFDVENSEHIDAERAKQNVYWDRYRGYTTGESREDAEQPDFSFEEIELAYYTEHYGDHIDAQNARNEKTRHTERNRTMANLLKNSKTCPEESIYQIGTMDESVPPEVLAQVATEFFEEFERRFGSHVHIIDWAIHLDEGTPHIHEHHVFDCKKRYGELCPQQEKALEGLGIELPNPDKPKSRNNNRKQTFDAICRTMLFDITRRHGLDLEQEPSYDGREYLEKQDYILMKQKTQMERQSQALSDQQSTIHAQTEIIQHQEGTIQEQADAIEAQGQKLEALTLKVEDVETLLDDVADLAYDKAVELVAAEVKVQTHQEAEAYGIPVRRNGMCLCPFHNNKNPSMKVDQRFHCFGCQADGDVIDFTAKLFGLTVKEAALKLAADFGVSYDTKGHDPPVKKPVKPKIRDELRQRQTEQRCFRAYADYFHLLEDWKDRYVPKSEDTDWHPLFVEALQKRDYVEYLLDTLLTGTEAEKAALVSGTRKEVAALERRVSGFKARDQQNGRRRGDGSRELAG